MASETPSTMMGTITADNIEKAITSNITDSPKDPRR